ncbi:hypothetical protein N0V94_007399 [Neodidymelliopsis sp. IMI 364377]|nr:hypothetical protein N0V94_007399 [Neodidymelliopsis sp. IMI 364377]
MASSLEKVSTEVFAQIIAHLNLQDLCMLARTTKAYRTIVQPLIWTVIETHRSDFHFKTVHDELRAEEATERMTPPYGTGPSEKERYYADDRAHRRGKELLRTFSRKELREGRKEELGALVRWLCLPIRTWNPSTLARSFAHFTNVEHLEISGFWMPNPGTDVFEAPVPGLRKLTTLKLRGYFSKKFVQWLLGEPGRIEELQLAILDRPVGSSNRKEWLNPPPPENQGPERTDNMTKKELVTTAAYENLAQEYVAPRALTCLTPEIMLRLVSLKRLYLCKPSNGCTDDSIFLYFSTPSDERILEEWSALLKATRKTLQHLTLDQRAVAEENVADGNSNKEYMRICANGPSYDRFVKMVLPVLLDSKQCPDLKVIRLFGFEAHDGGDTEHYAAQMDHPDCSVDVPGQLRAAFPDAEVSDYAGRRVVIFNDDGEITSVIMSSDLDENEDK